MREFIKRVHEENPVEFRTSTGELITPTEATFDISDSVVVEKRLRGMDDFGFVGESDEGPGGKRYDWLKPDSDCTARACSELCASLLRSRF